MKKILSSVLLILVMVFALGAQQAPAPKPEDVLKNMVLVDKIEPVPDKMKSGFESITARDSLAMLAYLSSDLLEGRETATRGIQLAAEYAASLFKLWRVQAAGDLPVVPRSMSAMLGGTPPAPPVKGYLQEFVMKEISDVQGKLTLELRKDGTVKSRAFESGIDFQSMTSTAESLSAPVVFAGYGIAEKTAGWDELKGIDVKGKIVLVISEAPGKNDPKSPFQAKELKEKYFPPEGPFAFRMGGFNKAREIAKLGALAVLQVQASGKDADLFKAMAGPRPVDDARPIINEPRRRLLIPGAGDRMPWESSPVITITREMADAILENSGTKIDDLQKRIEATYKPASMALPGTTVTLSTTAKTTLVRCRNVVGYIEGSDPVLKNEVVVVGAHYDHLGKRGDYVFNGADDNGSGSVGVMNLARAFAENPVKPKRTVVFCLWTGEEEGLLGSRYYVRNPAFPLDKTVAYLNLDMISRPYDEKTFVRMGRMFNFPAGQELMKKIKLADFLPILFAAGAGLDDVFREADRHIGLSLFLRESTSNERGGGGSDHSSFAAAKVPWVFCIAAMTDDYHQTSDSVEKVSGDLIEKISRLVYVAAYTIADK
ncbi:MAG TPA: M20/M25/M40 family metallo-hydrolase [Acidobacteriota bacterium]|nr:M20/M25/M40 family metallo-hydrolase [Acidobacteriota bacterium]